MEGLKIVDYKLQNDQRLIEKLFIAKKSNIEPLTAFIYESKNPIYLAKRLHLNQQQLEIIEGACKLNRYLEDIKANNI